MGDLKKEFNYYLKHQEELVKKYNGKFLVIKDQKIIDEFDSELDAYKNASGKFEAGTFLIQECLPGKKSHTQTFYSRVGV